ncbi:hypothetical protein EYF80_052825 [Liparis tanakae]|uniref:Uncharacterized protein n=1 Tax=Liparis tanakae TaxID=230148 RepID=A0A4Z2F6Y1_9TELE|nr:hypothetical protein EYF80_052825 [Liparis tanakae]
MKCIVYGQTSHNSQVRALRVLSAFGVSGQEVELEAEPLHQGSKPREQQHNNGLAALRPGTTQTPYRCSRSPPA